MTRKASRYAKGSYIKYLKYKLRCSLLNGWSQTLDPRPNFQVFGLHENCEITCAEPGAQLWPLDYKKLPGVAQLLKASIFIGVCLVLVPQNLTLDDLDAGPSRWRCCQTSWRWMLVAPPAVSSAQRFQLHCLPVGGVLTWAHLDFLIECIPPGNYSIL